MNKATDVKNMSAFLMKGIALGTQPDLVGSGLIRSAGGWSAGRSMRKAGQFQKSDERMSGDGEFVERVLSDARESMKTRYSLSAQGISIADILSSEDRPGDCQYASTVVNKGEKIVRDQCLSVKENLDTNK